MFYTCSLFYTFSLLYTCSTFYTCSSFYPFSSVSDTVTQEGQSRRATLLSRVTRSSSMVPMSISSCLTLGSRETAEALSLLRSYWGEREREGEGEGVGERERKRETEREREGDGKGERGCTMAASKR